MDSNQLEQLRALLTDISEQLTTERRLNMENKRRIEEQDGRIAELQAKLRLSLRTIDQRLPRPVSAANAGSSFYPIYVRYVPPASQETAETMTFRVSPTDTIDTIKARIQMREDIPSDQQRLMFAGNELKLGHLTIWDYNIEPESRLELIRLRLLHIATQNGIVKMTLAVAAADTVEQVKARIQEKEHIPVSEQRLYWNGKELDEDRRPLSDYNMGEETTLHLLIRFRGG